MRAAYLSLWIQESAAASSVRSASAATNDPRRQTRRAAVGLHTQSVSLASLNHCFSSHPSLLPLYSSAGAVAQTTPPPHWPVAELETSRSQSERDNITCVLFLNTKKLLGGGTVRSGHVWRQPEQLISMGHRVAFILKQNKVVNMTIQDCL